MSFSVIVPSKTEANMRACVAAVRRHEPDAEIVVIDDGIWPLVQELCEVTHEEAEPYQKWADFSAEHHPLTPLEGEKPFIFARNVNLGIRYSFDPIVIELRDREIQQPPRHDGCIILNDDALLQTPGGFTKLAEFAEAHPECGCVAPSTNVTGQPLQWPKHRTPEGWRYVDTLPYVCVYIPRRTVEQVGLLDERYCLDYGCEDLDHIEAMKRAGLKAAVVYDVFVDHGSLRSSFRGDPHAPKSFAKNHALFKAKWGIR